MTPLSVPINVTTAKPKRVISAAHILIKHAKSRNPVSRRTGKVTPYCVATTLTLPRLSRLSHSAKSKLLRS